jgi:hypothetical protein
MWYIHGFFCCHDNLMFLCLLIYTSNISITPSVPSIANACYRFSSSFREHRCKGNVSSFLVSVTWTVVLNFQWTLKLPVFAFNWFTRFKVIPTGTIVLCWRYCYVRPYTRPSWYRDSVNWPALRFSVYSLLMSPAYVRSTSESVCPHHCPFLLICVLCVSTQLLQFSAWTVGFVTTEFLWSPLIVLYKILFLQISRLYS